MAVTTAEIIKAVCGFADSTPAWDAFRDELLTKEAVELPGDAYAYYVEGEDAQADSYGDSSGPTSFVFRVEGASTGTAHFRKYGYTDSYDDREWTGKLEAVREVTVRSSKWESIA